MMKTKDLGHCSHTQLEINDLQLDDMLKLREECKGPFAGCSMCLTGDQMQLRCVAGESIPTGMVLSLLPNEWEVTKHYVPEPNKPTYAGREIAKMFSKVELTQLFRAEDDRLKEIINSMRDLNEYHPIKMEFLTKIPVLSHEHLRNNPKLRMARIAVTSNIERHFLIPIILAQHQKITGERVLYWKKPFCDPNMQSSKNGEQLYENQFYGKELKQYFQRGAYLDTSGPDSKSDTYNSGLAMLLHNICPTLNLVNGTLATLYGIVYNDQEVQHEQETRIQKGTEELEIPMPDYVLIELDSQQASNWPSHLSCVPGRYVIPLALHMCRKQYALRLATVVEGDKPLSFRYEQFDYEMAAVTTSHKLQV